MGRSEIEINLKTTLRRHVSYYEYLLFLGLLCNRSKRL